MGHDEDGAVVDGDEDGDENDDGGANNGDDDGDHNDDDGDKYGGDCKDAADIAYPKYGFTLVMCSLTCPDHVIADSLQGVY